MYSTTTSNVTVSVKPVYLDHESAPEKNIYVWAYTVRIQNVGEEVLQLRTRHWKITDAYGRVQEVHRGPAWWSEQPILKPGEILSNIRERHPAFTTLSGISGGLGSYSMQRPDV